MKKLTRIVSLLLCIMMTFAYPLASLAEEAVAEAVVEAVAETVQEAVEVPAEETAEEAPAAEEAEEASAVDVPAAEAPAAEEAVEAPAAEEKAAEAPAVEAPAAEEKQVETPVVEEKPAEAPAEERQEEAPVETPVEEKEPAEKPTETPVEEEKPAETPTEEAPAADEETADDSEEVIDEEVTTEEEVVVEELETEEEVITEEIETEEEVIEEAISEEETEDEANEEESAEENKEEDKPAEEASEEKKPEETEETETEEETEDEVKEEEVTDEESLTEEAQDASGNWKKDGDSWTYELEDGTLAKSTVLEIDGKYYGFNYYGYMYEDQQFWLNGYYYLANEEGALWTGWRQDDYGNWYYYESDGKAASGIKTIGGNTYYFAYYNYAGHMSTSQVVSYDDKIYKVGSDGHATEVKVTSGWISVDDNWYYVKDSSLVENQVEKIGNNYYYFDYSGEMLDNSTYASWNDGKYTYYRAKEGGALYVNAWYDDYGTWYYYGENGAGASGITKVGGKEYYFGEQGKLLTSAVFIEDGKLYKTDENGIVTASSAVKDGWVQNGDNWYYVKDKQLVTRQFVTEGTKKYYFNEDGLMAKGESFYANASGAYGYYRAKDSGEIVKGWYQDGSTWYYYDTEGRALSGVNKVDGKIYSFEWDGRMRTSAAVTYEGKNYIIDENGVAKDVTGKTGWLQNGTEWFYIQDNEFVTSKVIKIGSDYYGFNYNGRMYNSDYTTFSMYDSASGTYTYYRPKADGKLYVNEWCEIGGSWYYYGAGGVAASGITTIGKTTYYFGYRGLMETSTIVKSDGAIYTIGSNGVAQKVTGNGWKKSSSGEYYYVQSGNPVYDQVLTIDKKLYYFNGNGMMVADGSYWTRDGYVYANASGDLYTGGWKEVEKGTWKWFGSNGFGLWGAVKEIGGIKYAFDWYGNMRDSGGITYNGKNYLIAKNGHLVDASSGNGWKSEKDSNGNVNYYYIQSGALLSEEIQKINGKYYAFNEYGVMRSNDSFYGDNGRYRAKADGSLVTNSWFKDETNSWYYFEADGHGSQGLKTISGKTYIFQSGRMVTNGYYTTDAYTGDNANYYVDSNGIATKETKSGWVKHDNRWYYIRNGYALVNRAEKIDGKYYVFDETGALVTNQEYNAREVTDNYWNYYYYRTDKNGVALTGWQKDESGNWYYYESDGKGARGVKTIGGTVYAFYWDGEMLTYGTEESGGKTYYFGADGKGTVVTGSGWKQIGGDYYYFTSTNAVARNTKKTINGAEYAFDSYGRMVYDSSWYTWNDGAEYAEYFDANGKKVKNKWVEAWNGTWYYLDADGKSTNGLRTIGGKRYYFDDCRTVISGARNIDGENYYFDKNGVLTKNMGTRDGWQKIDGRWFYIKNGEVVRYAYLTIGGKVYYFEGNGVMEE